MWRKPSTVLSFKLICVTSTSSGKLFGFEGVAVILAGDVDFSGRQIFDRMVGAAMAEFEFIGFAAERLPQQLMAQTDAEHRAFWVFVHQFAG